MSFSHPPLPPSQPQFAPQPPPRPRLSSQAVQYWLVTIFIAFVAIAAVTVVIDHATTDVIGIIEDDPAAAFEQAPAMDAAYTLRASDGVESSGWMSVTEDGFAESTITDAFAGSATVRTTPDGSAAWGDASWWGRRVPSQASAVADQWVAPDDGVAFPFDIASDLTPAAVGEMIRSIDEEGQVDPDVTSYQGIPVVVSTHLDWTLIRTDTLPSTVLLLEGPISASIFHSAAAEDTDLYVVPAATATDPDGTFRPFGSMSGQESIAIQPTAVNQSGAEVVRSNASATVSGQSTAAPSQEPAAAAEESPEEATPPPAQTDLEAGQPSFTATVNASYCDTPTCTFTVTATNDGTAPGTAIVEASATPGLGPQTYDLGVIQPGQSKPTPTISMANQAPTPAPGQTTSVTVDYSAIVYSPEQHGPDEGKYRDLAGRIGEDHQYWLDSILSTVDAALKPTVIDSLDRMLDAEVPTEEALGATEWASSADPTLSDYSPLPVQSALAGYGDRFQGWPAIADQQQELYADDYTVFQAGLDAALSQLADPAEPTVTFIPQVGADGQTTAAEVISDYGTPETSQCTIVTGDGGQSAGTAASEALQSIEGEASPDFAERVANGCRVAVSILSGQNEDILSTDPASPNALLDGNQIEEELQSDLQDSGACSGSGPALDQVTVENRVGSNTWTGSELCNPAAAASISQTQIDVLNDLLYDTPLLDQLVERGAVTLDADGRVADIKWRKEDEECSSDLRSPVYAPTVDDLPPSPVLPSQSFKFKGGSQAQGAWVYLCGNSFPGGTSADPEIEPWDWPETNPKVAKLGQRARCHLIARMLGGTGDDVANLVTCFQKANNAPFMRNVETIVQRLAREQDIFYLVRPQYTGGNGNLAGIRVVAIGSNGLNLDVCVQNTVLGGFVLNGPC